MWCDGGEGGGERDYDRGLMHSPEFCGACHKQFIPEALNRFGLVAGQNQYDAWHSSHWKGEVLGAREGGGREEPFAGGGGWYWRHRFFSGNFYGGQAAAWDEQGD